MRQKRVKHATLEVLSDGGVITDLKRLDFGLKRVSLEIGSGKGQFITSLAQDYPDEIFVAMEVNINVCYRIMEKKQALNLENLYIILGDASHILAYFHHRAIDVIYLNFSDPWPKAKHHKRRLTYPSFLNNYKDLLKTDGFIQFRTDHETLFLDSITYFKSYFDVYEINEKHPITPYMTEYEEKKRAYGNIYQLKARHLHDSSNL